MSFTPVQELPPPAPAPRPDPPTTLTWALIAVNVVMFLGEGRWGGLEDSRLLYRMGAVLGGVPLADEPWRFLASTFLHFGLAHLLANMWALSVLGRSLETLLGPARLLTIYWISGLAGGIAAALWTPPHTLAAGASGAIWGVMVAQVVFVLRVRQRLGPGVVDGGLGRLLQPLVVNLGISFLPGISLAAHLGGGVAGGAVMALMSFGPSAKAQGRMWQVVAAVGVLLMVLSVALALGDGRPWIPLR